MNFSNFRPILAIGMVLTLVTAGTWTEAMAIGQASLDLDTCGCPTVFSPPIYQVTESGTETESDTERFLGSGWMVLSNSGELDGPVTSVIITLERVAPKKSGDAPGPGGENWQVLASAVANGYDTSDEARSCYGTFFNSAGSSLLLLQGNSPITLQDLDPIPPTLDNDGDGLIDEDAGNPCGTDDDGDTLIDEDPPGDADGDGHDDDDGDGLIDEDGPDDDGDGLIDEDGPCEDAVIIEFAYSFDITGMGIQAPGDGVVPSEDDLRIDLVVTFGSAGRRGSSKASCTLDVNYNGQIDYDNPDTPLVNEDEQKNFRSIQQRLQFDAGAPSGGGSGEPS